MLQAFEDLKAKSIRNRVTRFVVQPDEEQQRDLVIATVGKKLTSELLETEAKLYLERIKENEFRRQAAPEDDESSLFSEQQSDLESLEGGILDQPETSPTVVSFVDVLVNPSSSDLYLSSKIRKQAQIQMKNSKKIFDSLSSNYKNGIVIQCNHKQDYQDIDASSIAQVLAPTSSIASVKLEDANQVKKKEGILIIVDPSFNTENLKIKLQITYTKPIGLNNSEDITKSYPLWSNNDNSFKFTLSTNYQAGPPNEESPTSLPGWQDRSAIFVPAVKCYVSVVKDEDQISATESYKLSRLKLFAITAANSKLGVKKLHEFTENYFSTQAANVTVPGGLSALSIAASCGNVDAVAMLIDHGANVNTRNKNARFNTALIDATLGGHVEVAKYLLKSGANQLLKDEMGCTALHHACQLGDMSIARLLVNADGAKRALLAVNNVDQKAFDVCSNNYIKGRIEDAMRRLKVFVKPRVSLIARNIV